MNLNKKIGKQERIFAVSILGAILFYLYSQDGFLLGVFVPLLMLFCVYLLLLFAFAFIKY